MVYRALGHLLAHLIVVVKLETEEDISKVVKLPQLASR